MKKLILSIAALSVLVGSAQADLVLGTSNPAGNPLMMTAGTTSGPMLANVVSNNSPNDVMASWQFQLQIIPNTGTTGTLTFQDPATGTAPNPPNYVFDGHSVPPGIAATNLTPHSSLSANDFDANFGTPIPGGAGANLLQMDFLASSDASGVFGIYAVEGAANTAWTDSTLTTQFFSNVPNGTGTVLIGNVLVTGAQAIPEPSSLMLLGLASAGLIGGGWWRKRKQAATC